MMKNYVCPCGGCLCNQCANDVNNIRSKPEEMDEPCFNCEDCREYDGDCKKKYNHKESCENFKITEYHAKRNRAKIKLLPEN